MTDQHIPGGSFGRRSLSEAEAKAYRSQFQWGVDQHQMKIDTLNLLKNLIENGDQSMYNYFGHEGLVFIEEWVESKVANAVENEEREKRSCEWGILIIDKAHEIDQGKYYLMSYRINRDDHYQKRFIPELMAEHFGDAVEALCYDLGTDELDRYIQEDGWYDREGNLITGREKGTSK
jgi:hypothetical protein